MKRKMIIVSALLCSTFIFPAHAAERELSFRGITVGKKYQSGELTQALGFTCDTTYCLGELSIGSAYVSASVERDNDDTVTQINLSFASHFFDEVSLGLIEKFGKPDINERSEVQTAFGAKLPQDYLKWIDDSREVYTFRYIDARRSAIAFKLKQNALKRSASEDL